MSIILPKVYKDNSKEQKYKSLNNLPKISYSQYSAWNSIEYKPDYIKQYMVGIKLPDGIFSLFGSATGTYVEGVGTGNMNCHKEYEHLLSDSDREFLQTLEYPDNSIYEDYIVVDMGDYCIEGYMDRGIYNKKSVIVEDFKTGAIKKKKDYYASSDYQQTRLYSYQKENEGYEIEDCRVLLLDRAGNNSAKSPIRLTGEIEVIPTPYDRKDTEVFLEDVTRTVHEISDYYKQYLKFFK